MINDYFISIRAQIEKFHYIIHDFSIEEKVYSEDKGFISGKITFTNSSILEFGEVKDITIRDKIK